MGRRGAARQEAKLPRPWPSAHRPGSRSARCGSPTTPRLSGGCERGGERRHECPSQSARPGAPPRHATAALRHRCDPYSLKKSHPPRPICKNGARKKTHGSKRRASKSRCRLICARTHPSFEEVPRVWPSCKNPLVSTESVCSRVCSCTPSFHNWDPHLKMVDATSFVREAAARAAFAKPPGNTHQRPGPRRAPG